MAKTLKGGLLLSAGLGLGQGLSFLRNLVVANFLAPDDFGIAMSFAITVFLLESLSDMAWDRMLVQAPDGDDDELMACAHFLTFLRGVISATVVFLIAGPLSKYYSCPEALWAYRTLALVPIIRSFVHLERKRDHRHMEFKKDVATEITSQIVGAFVGSIAALLTQHWSCMLTAILAQSMAWALMSRFVANVEYRWVVSKEMTLRFFRFGWPLIINGFLIFSVTRGDMMVIGGEVNMSALGVYAVASLLVFAPGGIITRVVSTLYLPRLSACQDDAVSRLHEFSLCRYGALVTALPFVTFYGLGSSAVVELLYPEKYNAAGSIIPWLAIAGGIRILRSAYSTAALSCGATTLPMHANILRASLLLVLLFAARAGWTLVQLASLAAIGESLALLGIAGMLANRFEGAFKNVFFPFFLVVAFGYGLQELTRATLSESSPLWRVVLALASSTCVLVVVVIARQEVQDSVLKFLGRKQGA